MLLLQLSSNFGLQNVKLGIIIFLVVLFLFLPICIGIAAQTKGRSGFGWFLLSILIGPLFSMLLLLITGETDAKRKEWIVEDERIREAERNRNTKESKPDDYKRFMPH